MKKILKPLHVFYLTLGFLSLEIQAIAAPVDTVPVMIGAAKSAPKSVAGLLLTNKGIQEIPAKLSNSAIGESGYTVALVDVPEDEAKKGSFVSAVLLLEDGTRVYGNTVRAGKIPPPPAFCEDTVPASIQNGSAQIEDFQRLVEIRTQIRDTNREGLGQLLDKHRQTIAKLETGFGIAGKINSKDGQETPLEMLPAHELLARLEAVLQGIKSYRTGRAKEATMQ